MKALFNGLQSVLNVASDSDIITYNDINYKCRCSQREIRLNLESAGFLNIKALSVYINQSIGVDEIIEYNGTQYRVMQVSNYSQNLNKLQCEELL